MSTIGRVWENQKFVMQVILFEVGLTKLEFWFKFEAIIEEECWEIERGEIECPRASDEGSIRKNLTQATRAAPSPPLFVVRYTIVTRRAIDMQQHLVTSDDRYHNDDTSSMCGRQAPPASMRHSVDLTWALSLT